MEAEKDLMFFDNSYIINVKFGGYATIYSGNDICKVYELGKYLNLFKRRYAIDYEGEFSSPYSDTGVAIAASRNLDISSHECSRRGKNGRSDRS